MLNHRRPALSEFCRALLTIAGPARGHAAPDTRLQYPAWLADLYVGLDYRITPNWELTGHDVHAG